VTYRATDLPDALRDQGVEPVLVAGYLTRGVPFAEVPRISLEHWTAGPATGRAPSLQTVTNGRSDLPGPLCAVLQERTGGPGLDRAYVVATGVANHAGEGVWAGITSGNRRGLGNEVEWSGPGEDFPGNRYETSVRILAAFQSLHPTPAGLWVCNHREYALPRGRKIDTNLDGPSLRADVQSLLDGDDDMNDDDRRTLQAVAGMVLELKQGLMPRPMMRASTAGPNIGQLVPADQPGEPVSDVWRMTVENTVRLREELTPAAIAEAVVKALPATSGGSGPSLAEIEATVAKVVDAQLGFLKPGK
jgi:hypothetical protein